MDSYTFMQDVTGYARAQMPRTENKMARIDYSFDISKFPQELPKVLFDGESTITSKGYEVMAPYMPMPGDRVLMLRVSDTYIIAGAVQKTIQTWTGGAINDYSDITAHILRTTAGDVTEDYGPEVSLYTGSTAEVTITANLRVITGDWVEMSYEVSGATSIAPSSARCISLDEQGSLNKGIQLSASYLMTDLTPGYNVFTAKYRVGSGDEGEARRRHLSVKPF